MWTAPKLQNWEEKDRNIKRKNLEICWTCLKFVDGPAAIVSDVEIGVAAVDGVVFHGFFGADEGGVGGGCVVSKLICLHVVTFLAGTVSAGRFFRTSAAMMADRDAGPDAELSGFFDHPDQAGFGDVAVRKNS